MSNKKSNPDGQKKKKKRNSVGGKTELSTGLRGLRGSMGLTDLRMSREGLEPTMDINVVEPNVSGNRDGVF